MSVTVPPGMFWTGKGPPPEELARHLSDPVNAARVDEISDADREWFLENPGRRCRLRPRRSGEGPPDDVEANHIFVVQLAPGFRVRCPVVLFDLLPDDDGLLYRAAIKLLQETNPKAWRGIKHMAREIARRERGRANR